ncbi:MAG: gamma-glutamyltransferase [Acidimicrobiia bacterium]|nr:gamma-glutamyltransferase [Acidimicrobiia bacterium]
MTHPPDREGGAELATGARPATTGVAVSPHHLASRAGVDILGAGGNAVDAAIAVNAMLGVVAPETCGPGGDLFALVHVPGEPVPRTLNSSGRAGSGWTSDMLRDAGHGSIPLYSPWSVSVPGCVDGWVALSDTLGRLPLGDVLAPAIETARAGFRASAELASALERLRDSLLGQPSATALYPDGRPPAPGTTIRRPDLAATLEGVARNGRDAFYLGRVGDAIARATDGVITASDLAVDQARWIEPASIEVFGRTAWTIPPNSQGYLTLAALWIFEHLGPPRDPSDPLFHHLLVEAYRSVAWERAQFVSEPDTATAPAAALLDPERLARIARTIDRDRAGRWPMPPPAPGGTAYMAVRDSGGMAVSYIQSNYHGIGSRLSAGDTGVFLHNRAAGFNLIQGHPNEYTPGNRPMHTLAPTLWTSGGNLDLVLGTRGGDQQPQYLAQFAAHHFHAGLDIAAAQIQPRWSMEQPLPGTDSAVSVESRMGGATVDALSACGHHVTEAGPWQGIWGPVSAIHDGGTIEGAADPRITTSAALTFDG